MTIIEGAIETAVATVVAADPSCLLNANWCAEPDLSWSARSSMLVLQHKVNCALDAKPTRCPEASPAAKELSPPVASEFVFS